MKKVLLILVLFSVLGCSNNCDELENDLENTYYDALFRCGNSASCRLEIKRQYEANLAQIRSNCK